MGENMHLAEEYFESLWSRCETEQSNGRQDLASLPLPAGGFLLLCRTPGAWTAWLLSPSGECKPAKSSHLRRILEIV